MLSSNFYETKVIKVMENKTIKIKINTDFPLHGVKTGQEITIEVDANGVPLDKNWRRRLRDSAIDNSIEIVGTKTKTKKDD